MSIETHTPPSKRWWTRNWLTLTAVALVLILDQLTKLWVRSTMAPWSSVLEWSPVQLTYVLNSGSAFGLFPRQTLFLTAAAFIGIGVLFLYYRNFSNPPLLVRISLGMMIGGAIGNLIDRLRFGYVVDFIDFHYWPVFNLADSSITIGIIILGWVLLTSKERKQAVTTTPIPSTDASRDKPGL